MTTISLKLPEALLRQITREAEGRRVGKSAVIRHYLEHGLRRAKKTEKAPSCLELMGSSARSFRGPRDLSTNRNYLSEAVLRANRANRAPRANPNRKNSR